MIVTDDQQFTDRDIVCRECRTTFVFDAREQQFFAQQQWRPPIRCHACRRAAKAARERRAEWEG